MLKDLHKKLFTEFEHHTQNTPNHAVPNGPVCGNGDLGVVMDLAENAVRLWLSKNDFWCYRPHQLGGGMKSPAFLTVSVGGLEGAAPVLWQDAATGHIGWRCHKDGVCASLEVFVPRGENAVLLQLSCDGGSLSYAAQADTLSSDPLCGVSRSSGADESLVVKSYTGNAVERSSSAATALTALDADLCGTLAAGESVFFVAAVATENDGADPASHASDVCRGATPEIVCRLADENLRWWEDFWNRSRVSLPDFPEIERVWYLSQYILACCCDRDRFAPGIFGNFLTSDSPNWGGDYHLNYNHEAPFWGLYSSNHIEIADAYDRPVLEYTEKARENARTRLHCRGLYAKVGVGPQGCEISAMFNEDGSPNAFRPYWGQKSNAAYAGLNFIMRYYHTLDRDYLEKKAYPYLLQVIDFWEDYLVYENGRYVDKNDFIHEDGDTDFHAEDREWQGNGTCPDRNPAVSLALIRVILRALLDMSETLDRDGPRREKWRHMLAHLSPYSTQLRDGRRVLRYTEAGMDWCDDNSLGIQPVYPVGDVGLDSDPALLQLFRDTHAVMARWEDYNAFPTFYTAAARLGCEPDEIITHMRTQLLSHGYPNGFIYYGGGGIECCSAVPSTINDMLVQNYAGRLRLFPVWNRNHDVSFRDLRVYGAFLVSAKLSGGNVSDVRIFSEKGGAVSLVLPEQGEIAVRCGERMVSTDRTALGDVRFETQPGWEYDILVN